MGTTKHWKKATLAALPSDVALIFSYSTALAKHIAPSCGNTLGPGGTNVWKANTFGTANKPCIH
jgi:hypothetical protein